MKEAVLPAAPRVLAPGLEKKLWWGTALMLFALSSISLVLVATLFMFLLYGIPASALLGSGPDVVRVTSQISRKEKETLPAGDRLSVVWAPVRVNEAVIEARGYGPAAEAAEIGDSVEILVPKSNPAAATLEGFQAYPVRPETLLLFAGLFMIPGAATALFAWLRGRRSRALLTEGVEILGDRLRTVPLPRPLKDMALVRWEYSSEGVTGRLWVLQKADWKRPPLLVAGGNAALLHSLLSEPMVQDGLVGDGSRLRKVFGVLNSGLLALCILTLTVFVFL